MKSIVLLALSMPLFGHAEVYKCVENGKTVYAQIPCSATAVRIRSSEDSAAEQQRLRDAAAQRQAAEAAAAEAARDVRSRSTAPIPIVIQSAEPRRPSKRDYCNQLLRTAKAAKDEANMYRYHQGLIDDAKRRQKEAEDEHFSNCYGSNY